MNTTPTVPELSGALERLRALDTVLDGERNREDADETPDAGIIRDVAVQLRVELHALEVTVEEFGEWGAPAPVMAAAYAVSLENLQLAGLALQRVEGRVNSHTLLHCLRDAVFHTHRAAEGLQKLEHETMEESRRVSREENRQDFMSG